MIETSLIDSIAAQNILGECVLWCEQEQKVFWVDIQSKKLFSLSWPEREMEVFTTPLRLGAFTFSDKKDTVLAAFDTGFALFNYRTGSIQWLHRLFRDGSGLRLNDGRIDAQGNFWCGAMVESNHCEHPEGAKLYRVGKNGELDSYLSHIGISNGICWSPNGKTLYFADSSKNVIYNFSTDTKNIGEAKLFVATPVGASPDGAVTDENGRYWGAQWGAGKIVAYSSKGNIEHTLDCPASQVTCLAFGGPNLDLIFATSASEGLTASQLAKEDNTGDLFIYQSNVRGGITPRFSTALLQEL